jgi:hypothetical protein
LATVALLVECLSREARVQVAQTFGEAPVLSALEAAREREAQAAEALRRKLDMLAGLPYDDDARHETHLSGVAWLMRQRAANKLGSAV